MSEPKLAAESQDQFDRLQKKLVPLWKSIECLNQDPQTIVVVPSMSIDGLGAGAVMQAYEERFLFLLLLLRQPRARLIYVTSICCPASSRVMRVNGCSCFHLLTAQCSR
jgi:hypothetical protein